MEPNANEDRNHDAGRRVVITGTSRGLGKALAEALIEAGHTVIGCGRSERAQSELTERFGFPHDFTALDVSESTAVRRWAKGVLEQGGPPDLLINNAAIINEPANFWEIPTEEVARLIDVNIKGTVYTLHAFLPAMVERRQGVIVNLSSGWGRSTSPRVAPYCCSKWAIEGLTRALAQELPEPMAAVPLNPGVIQTDMLRTVFGDGGIGRGSTEDWARDAMRKILGFSRAHNGQPASIAGS